MDCGTCGKPAQAAAVALAATIVGPACREVWCLSCLARRFGTNEAALLDAARLYRDRGCTLFAGIDLDRG